MESLSKNNDDGNDNNKEKKKRIYQQNNSSESHFKVFFSFTSGPARLLPETS